MLWLVETVVDWLVLTLVDGEVDMLVDGVVDTVVDEVVLGLVLSVVLVTGVVLIEVDIMGTQRNWPVLRSGMNGKRQSHALDPWPTGGKFGNNPQKEFSTKRERSEDEPHASQPPETVVSAAVETVVAGVVDCVAPVVAVVDTVVLGVVD